MGSGGPPPPPMGMRAGGPGVPPHGYPGKWFQYKTVIACHSAILSLVFFNFIIIINFNFFFKYLHLYCQYNADFFYFRLQFFLLSFHFIF